jgi:hypothetical protein
MVKLEDDYNLKTSNAAFACFPIPCKQTEHFARNARNQEMEPTPHAGYF